jgi:hypothetical protein
MVIDEEAQNILLDAKIVGRDTKLSRVRYSSGLAHSFRPGRNREFDRAFFPAISLLAGNVACEFLPRHGRQLLSLVDQLLGRRAVGGHDATHGAGIANMADERARVDIPNSRDFMAIQIELRGFGGTPVRGDLRKLANNKRFDIRPGRFFIIKIGANIADMRIGQAHDLPGVTRIGENLLIAGKACIENDFAASACDSASGAAVKDASVFQSESGRSMLNFGQVVLREGS